MVFEWSAVGTVVINGVRLGYREAGDPSGRPVVLLHGCGSSSRTWDRFAARLEGHRVLAVDLRGHATSARPGSYALTSLGDDLVGLLEAFDLRGTVLVGHSVGAYAALDAARRVADRIAGLVLEDLAAPPRTSQPSVRGINPWQVLTAVFGILTVRQDYDLRAMAALLRQLSRPDAAWWSRLGHVEHPTLVLSGGPTSCIPPRRLAEATLALPGARLATIPVGHRVHSLAPERFATEVLAFLNQAAVASSPAGVSR
ncbi:alpha/beta fold hydrolase [Paractinoplanes lichenicola]|uniref:Alpha/beta hydrolase n=1 Tax=Paractinoplanes lichenicola TaxID=2802976 RepID=A0ABS1VWA6_9ACTN|nr:alpha/beta hydrolase [Actinoplanes lichenicola]MBL7258770.1 alpha/beta hydrolase [Actinoplanes lichenicola]